MATQRYKKIIRRPITCIICGTEVDLDGTCNCEDSYELDNSGTDSSSFGGDIRTIFRNDIYDQAEGCGE